MQSGAQRQTTKRPRLEKLQHDGNVVVDASARFAQRRVHNLAQAANPLPVPDSGSQAHSKTVAPRPHLTISPLKSRVVMDDRMAFILFRDSVIGAGDNDGTRCMLFTVIPTPLAGADDERYLMPYLRRGWTVMYQSRERPGLPGAVDMHPDPYVVFRNFMDSLKADDRADREYRIRGGLHFVSDPLSR
jgi:hypothetical protein